ncbi:MAG TPA: hypothetical protein VKU82_07125 [Planctomycetaceae bacterium]|nr:hypothetical protein [Planctomycetaceae bacterium]
MTNPPSIAIRQFNCSSAKKHELKNPASEFIEQPVVWAIDAERLRNYLVPRDCPRIAPRARYQNEAADTADSLR